MRSGHRECYVLRRVQEDSTARIILRVLAESGMELAEKFNYAVLEWELELELGLRR
jgi:hypothetical protein